MLLHAHTDKTYVRPYSLYTSSHWSPLNYSPCPCLTANWRTGLKPTVNTGKVGQINLNLCIPCSRMHTAKEASREAEFVVYIESIRGRRAVPGPKRALTLATREGMEAPSPAVCAARLAATVSSWRLGIHQAGLPARTDRHHAEALHKRAFIPQQKSAQPWQWQPWVGRGHSTECHSSDCYRIKPKWSTTPAGGATGAVKQGML